MSSQPAATIIQGTVKWFKLSQGASPEVQTGNYGFITKSNGESIFVHGSDVDPEHYPLFEGDIVEFTTKPSPIPGHTDTAAQVRRIGHVDNGSVPAVFRGEIKWFGGGGGRFGFITKSDGVDIFVHVTNVKAEELPLEPGDAVDFKIKAGKDGKPTAFDVRRVQV
jgi:cold shock CspA family protein